MKRLLVLILALGLLLTFVACGDKNGDGADESETRSGESESELADESILTESESQSEIEEDDWFGEEEESETQPDRWTDNH